ncbi:hypothetical protein EDF46_2462 [Frondihabitans sp. PhB188]|uniref:hypothetical protein n=1 Tax=Frondihabitans sp. PhB188 TaxID=2485200 RepID=UPI000F494B1D|nr:hypothetical protein [Frondihabitans sp. PhB188]ROQ37018.1 hypothetical protein EDF46_2462 [Frondihabitans sp. PhB188]
MDGYAICKDRRDNFEQITRHAETHAHLIRLLEECAPLGSMVVGIVLSYGSQIQPRAPLELIT